jgi:hypothetical protein
LNQIAPDVVDKSLLDLDAESRINKLVEGVHKLGVPEFITAQHIAEVRPNALKYFE